MLRAACSPRPAAIFSAASIVPLGLLFGLIATALAYGFYFSGLSKISQAGKVPVIASVEVVVATVIGALAFTERMTAVRVLGIALVLFSIVLFNMKAEDNKKRSKMNENGDIIIQKADKDPEGNRQ